MKVRDLEDLWQRLEPGALIVLALYHFSYGWLPILTTLGRETYYIEADNYYNYKDVFNIGSISVDHKNIPYFGRPILTFRKD